MKTTKINLSDLPSEKQNQIMKNINRKTVPTTLNLMIVENLEKYYHPDGSLLCTIEQNN